MNSLQRLFTNITKPKLLLLSVIIGILGAFSAFIFYSLINIVTRSFFGSSGGTDFIATVEALPLWYRILIPAVGGLLVGLIYKVSKVYEVKGEGVPEVVDALTHSEGKIRPLVAPLKVITAALTIGTGGSADREGSIVQIGSAVGSGIAQYLKLNTKDTSLLLAAGATAGIAGTFNAPLAGVIFSVEVLLKRVTTFGYIQLIVAALTSAYIARKLNRNSLYAIGTNVHNK